jgi:hypothetical protein
MGEEGVKEEVVEERKKVKKCKESRFHSSTSS